MLKQLGLVTSFLFLWTMALFTVGCSNNRCCYDNGNYDNGQYYDNGYYSEGNNEFINNSDISAASDVSQPIVEVAGQSVCCPPANCCPQPPSCQPPACGQRQCPPSCECGPSCNCGPSCQGGASCGAQNNCCAPRPVMCEEPLCKMPVRCKHPPSNRLQCWDFITVTARNPQMCILGDEYPLDFDVHACEDVCDVVVTTHLPEGVTLMNSQPRPMVEGRKLTWMFGPMSKGECRSARVMLKCECEGELCACFCATATPVRFCSLLCAKPLLVCHKCGPEEVCPGEAAHYTITVTNRGSCTAEEVVVTDKIPVEMEHSSGLRTLTYRLGCLAPCESKTINLCLMAVNRGQACNTAVVTACNADTTSCQWCTNIACCAVEILKDGPKEVTIGKNADYQIVVTNTGDKLLTDVVVTDMAPSATSIVAAKGARVCGNEAVWRLRELKPGERVTFGITLTTCTPGCFTNRVSVTDCQGCNDCTEFTTRWRGRPCLNVCTRGCEPACIGERTSYTIDVTNNGSEADNNVGVIVRFPKELRPVSAAGATPAEVSGQTVTFAPLNDFRPRQTLTYRVDAEAVSSGDARVSVEVSSDTLKPPVVQQESTIVN